MKKIITLALAALVSAGAMAQDIKLPAADLKQKSMSVVEALATRHSVREYSNKKLSNQELSNLCWAACGVARDGDHRTAPTAMNRKEIRLYVFMEEGTYEYIATENLLKKVANGDSRMLMAGAAGGFKQEFAGQAPISLLMVADLNIFGSSDEHSKSMCIVDAGIVCENINLYCQAVGLATVPRATMDSAAIVKLLGLDASKQIPVLNNPVGYAK